MQKDFDEWNKRKKEIDSREINFNFREGDVRWAYLGLNIGHEENGKGFSARRPVLIVRKFSSNLAYIVPLSTQCKNTPYYLAFAMRVQGKNYSLLESAMLSQSKTMSSKRFGKKLGWVGEEELKRIKETLKEVL